MGEKQILTEEMIDQKLSSAATRDEQARHLSPNERLWTRDEVCEFLGCKKTALYVMVSRKEIPFLYVNNKLRFIPEQMWAWAKKRANENKA